MLIADVFITTKGRLDLLLRSLSSFAQQTPADQYRLTIIDDTGDLEGNSKVVAHVGKIVPSFHCDDYVLHSKNLGLGPSINQALANINATNEWHGHSTHGDPTQVSPFVVYCQDDLLYARDWLTLLARRFAALEQQHKLSFASGLECVEHREGLQDIGNGMLLKSYIRAAHMFGRRETWMSMWPIPPLDPETGRKRAKPNDGVGSGVDWHFIRNHPNSAARTGRPCLVIPGLVKHMGFDRSTWLDRELPESDSDKEAVRKTMTA